MAGGSVSLVVVFLFFVFSGLGLSMIYLSQVHLKMNAYRKSSLLVDFASENGLKRGLGDLTDALDAAGGSGALEEATLEEFRAAPAALLPRLLEEGLGVVFPRRLEESEAGANWESLATCAMKSAEDRGGYFRVAAALTVTSSGGLDRLRPRRRSSLEGTLGFLAGHLPLSAIPLLIGKEMSEAERSGFLGSNGISLVAAGGNLLAPAAPAAAGGVIPKDATPLVAKALDVRLFKPQDLSAPKLRAALGLEASDEPVPEGVYLIRTDLGLGGVYVQGDLDEMVLAVDGDAQVIAFRLAAGEWVLRFSPARSRTEFATPAGTEAFDAVPLGIVIVSGQVGALGGGVVGGDGRATLVCDREVPSVLSGVGLTLVSSGRVTLASHLILQGVRWQDGIPYIKEPQTQLVIFSTGRDLATGEDAGGGIAVGAGSPQDLKLQASLTAAAGRVEIGGSGKTVELLGALHAPDYEGHGNELRIVRDERAAAGGLDRNAPVTAGPRLCLSALRIVSWREHE